MYGSWGWQCVGDRREPRNHEDDSEEDEQSKEQRFRDLRELKVVREENRYLMKSSYFYQEFERASRTG